MKDKCCEIRFSTLFSLKAGPQIFYFGSEGICPFSSYVKQIFRNRLFETHLEDLGDLLGFVFTVLLFMLRLYIYLGVIGLMLLTKYFGPVKDLRKKCIRLLGNINFSKSPSVTCYHDAQ